MPKPKSSRTTKHTAADPATPESTPEATKEATHERPAGATHERPGCEPTGFASPLPDRIAQVEGDGRIFTQLQDNPLQLRLTIEALAEFNKDFARFILSPNTEHMAADLYQRFVGFLFARTDVRSDLEAINRPPNADMLADAGESMIDATALPEGAVLKTDSQQIRTDLTRRQAHKKLLDTMEWPPGVVRLNMVHAEQRIATAIDRGLDRVSGMLPTEPALRGTLGGALAWDKISGVRAKASRRHNAQLTEQVRAEDRAGGGAAPGSGTTGAVTPAGPAAGAAQPNPPPVPAPAPPPPPTPAGRLPRPRPRNPRR